MKRVAVVGATGAVGTELRCVLAQREFPAESYRLFASARSAGRRIDWVDGPLTVAELGPSSFDDVDLAFFSAGAPLSREYVPLAQAAGAIVIDNSSAFRMNADVPLVIPEINAKAVRSHNGILAVPNCSTIIMAVVLWPLHRVHPIRRVVVCTYQAISGAGARALAELESQTADVLAGHPPTPHVLPVPCAFNVFSHNTPIGEDGYNVEESKMIAETRKIFGDDTLRIAPTCMRVPVRRVHTEALSIEFESPISEQDAREILRTAPGLEILDDRAANRFPTPLEAEGRDEVHVGRIRCDPTIPEGRGLQLICAGDQLRKGAALNAVQIAELLSPGSAASARKRGPT